VTDGLRDINENPHMWFEARRSRGQYVGQDPPTLSDGAPIPREKRRTPTNAQKYSASWSVLERAQARSRPFPPTVAKLVTSHDAFPYFSRGIRLRGHRFPRSQKPDKLPSAGELADLVDKVKAAKAPAIFSRRCLASARETIAKETGAKVITDLPTDSCRQAGDSYIGLMRVVVDKIVAALK